VRLTIEVDFSQDNPSDLIKVYQESCQTDGDDFYYSDMLEPKLRKLATLLRAVRLAVKASGLKSW